MNHKPAAHDADSGKEPRPAPNQAARLTLRAGRLRAEVAPAIGGSLSAFFSVDAALDGADPAAASRHDWLRPASDAALASGDPLGMASFPMLPWCNRIREGRFQWRGRSVRLAPNFERSPHTIHGLGWRHAWRVGQVGAAQVTLLYSHAGGSEWPFAFEAEQRYALDETGLAIDIALTNTGARTMPAGIGHHPYLPHRREGVGTRVQAVVERMWESDADHMPTGLSASHPAVAALRHGLVLADHALDNNFTGFGHWASVRWPDGRALTLLTGTPLDHFVLYSPSDKEVFCMEAVSNCTDWINLRAQDAALPCGGHALARGQTLRASIRLNPT